MDSGNPETLSTQQALKLTYALLHSLPERPDARIRNSLLLSGLYFVSVNKTGLKSGYLGFWLLHGGFSSLAVRSERKISLWSYEARGDVFT